MKLLIKTLLLIFFISVFVYSQAQDSSIDNISLTFKHSKMRYKVSEISITEDKDSSLLRVHIYSTKNNETLKDSTFRISQEQVLLIKNAVLSINANNIKERLAFNGFDGTKYTLKFGNFQNSITYELWTPDYETDNYKINDFLDCCILIIEQAGYDFEEFNDYGG